MTEVMIGLGLIFGVTIAIGTALGIAVVAFALAMRVADNILGD